MFYHSIDVLCLCFFHLSTEIIYRLCMLRDEMSTYWGTKIKYLVEKFSFGPFLIGQNFWWKKFSEKKRWVIDKNKFKVFMDVEWGLTLRQSAHEFVIPCTISNSPQNLINNCRTHNHTQWHANWPQLDSWDSSQPLSPSHH